VGPYRQGTGLLICLAPCPGPALGLGPMLQDPGERLLSLRTRGCLFMNCTDNALRFCQGR